MEFKTDYIELLSGAEKCMRTADHLIYITYPLIKENRLLKKILEEIYEAVIAIISAILQYESLYKRIEIKQDQKTNWEIFKNRCAPRFNLTGREIESLETISILAEKYRQSNTEFTRKDKLIIMTNNSRTESIDLENLKKHLNTIKPVLQKSKNKIIQKV